MADCFVHASDLHLDAPLGSLGYLREVQRKDLADRAGQAWDALVQLCIDERASFCVLAGDIFDDAIADVGVQLRFQRGLRRLDEEGVHVFICHGNHDPLSSDFRQVGDLPQRVVRFEPGRPQSHQVELRHSGDLVQVSGVSFGKRHERENLALCFGEIERQPNSAAHVAVLHANVGADPGHDPYAPCSWDDLDAAPVDYWALGHIHKRAVRRLPGGAWAAYCGNLQGRSFKPSECELKGALVVPVDSGQVGKPAFKPCDQVRFARSKVEVGPDDTIEDVCVKITDEASKLGSEHSALPVAWELRLTGHNADAARLRDAVRDCDAPLLTDMADELSDRLNGGGLCRVEMAVRAAVNRESVLAGHDLRADVLRELEMCRKQIHDKSVADDSSGLEKPGRAQADASEFGKQLPSKVASVWEEMIAERPERLDDILALAEELLLEIFADGVAEGS